jgi:hypothetical protein
VVVEVDLAAQSAGGAVAAQTALVPDNPGPLFTWSFAPALASNGRYDLSATALTAPAAGDPPTQTQATTSFVVDVPPQAPTGLISSVNPVSRTASLAWSPNPEPDLVSYLILRAGPGASAAFAPINIVGASTRAYTDAEVASEPPGLYRYAVVAIRSGGTTRTVPSRQSAPTTVVFTTPALAAPKAWGHPTLIAPPAPGPAQTTTRTPPRVGTAPGVRTPTLPPAATASGASTPASPAPAVPAQTQTAPSPPPTTQGAAPPSVPATQVPAASPAGAPSKPGIGVVSIAGSGGSRRTVLQALAGALILCVLMLFVAVRRERHRRDAPLDPLEPDVLLADLGVGGRITVGEALARRAGPPPPDEAGVVPTRAPTPSRR